MQIFLSVIIGILGAVAFAVLGVAVFGQYQLLTANEIGNSERFALLPGIAVSAGVLIAALSFFRERLKAETESHRHASEVILNQASSGFKTVIELLADQNNSRITWIRAARTLLQAIKLGKQINTEEYKIAYKLEEERARNELYKLLTRADPKTKERQPLPPQFFYGIEDWQSCPSLDEAAIKASNIIEAHTVSIDAVPPSPSLRPLAARSVVAIFNFIEEYPKDYQDPLDDVTDWDENWDQKLFGISQGARRYVAHKKKKHAVDGKIYDLQRG